MYADKDRLNSSGHSSERYYSEDIILELGKSQVLHGMPISTDTRSALDGQETHPFLTYYPFPSTKKQVTLSTQTESISVTQPSLNLKSHKFISSSLDLQTEQNATLKNNNNSSTITSVSTGTTSTIVNAISLNDSSLSGADSSHHKFAGQSLGSLGTTITQSNHISSHTDEDERHDDGDLEEGEIAYHSHESSEEFKSSPKDDILTPSTAAGSPKDMQSLTTAAFFDSNLNPRANDQHNSHEDSHIIDTLDTSHSHQVPSHASRSPWRKSERFDQDNDTSPREGEIAHRACAPDHSIGEAISNASIDIAPLSENFEGQFLHPCDHCFISKHLDNNSTMNYKDTMDHSTSNRSSNSSNQAINLRRDWCDQNLFVFHLPSEWREQDLKQAFSAFGRIISTKVVKRPDGSSKGYGFVCFEDRGSAIDALEKMNGFVIGGKRLKVSLKKTPEECLRLQVQKLMRMAKQNCAFDRDRDCSLFVFHLPPHWNDTDLKQAFLSFGAVTNAKVSRKEDGTSRGYGFVTCADPKSAAMAIMNLNGLQVANKRLKVQPKQLGAHNHPKPDCTVFIFHLPNDWTDNALRQIFGHSGRVITATVQRDSKGRSRGFGFVTFDKPQSARDAVADLNGLSIGAKRLKVSLKKSMHNDSIDPSREEILRNNHFEKSDYYSKDEVNTGSSPGSSQKPSSQDLEHQENTPRFSRTAESSMQNRGYNVVETPCGSGPMKLPGTPAECVRVHENLAELPTHSGNAVEVPGTACVGLTGNHFVARNTTAVMQMDYHVMQHQQKLVGANPEIVSFHQQNLMNESFGGNNIPGGQSLVYDPSPAALRVLQQTLLNQSTAAILSGSSTVAPHHLQAALSAAMTHINQTNGLPLADVSTASSQQFNQNMLRYEPHQQPNGPQAASWAATTHIPYTTTHPSLAAVAASIPIRSTGVYNNMVKFRTTGNNMNLVQRSPQQSVSVAGQVANDKYSFHHKAEEGLCTSNGVHQNRRTPAQQGEPGELDA